MPQARCGRDRAGPFRIVIGRPRKRAGAEPGLLLCLCIWLQRRRRDSARVHGGYAPQRRRRALGGMASAEEGKTLQEDETDIVNDVGLP